ncbi:MAG: radical SAM protein, partial [Patescibacteria group bacterium]
INALGKDELLNLPENLENINISGGEPFLRTDLPELIGAIKTRCPKAKVIISTNGFATDAVLGQMEKILKTMPEIGVAVSLDGVSEKHDQIRGIPGGFEKATATLKGLQKMGATNLRIGFTLGDYNTEELEKMYDFADQLGIQMTLAVVHSSENYFSKDNAIKNKEVILEKLDWLMKKELGSFDLKRWARAYFAYGLKYFVQSGKRILPDYSGILNVFIDPLGDIYASDVSTTPIGKLDKTGMKISHKKDSHESWMICTARTAIKKHWFKAGFWIVKNKLYSSYENLTNK